MCKGARNHTIGTRELPLKEDNKQSGQDIAFAKKTEKNIQIIQDISQSSDDTEKEEIPKVEYDSKLELSSELSNKIKEKLQKIPN